MRLRFVAAGVALLLLGACSSKAETATLGAPVGATVATASPVVSPVVVDPTPAARATPVARADGPASHDAERAMAHVRQLAGAIGPRVSGTANEAAAAAYIKGQFESSGYAVENMEFTFEGDRFLAGSVAVDGAAVESVALAGSAGGQAAGPAVYVGLADEAGMAGRPLKGAIAIADRGTLRFADKYANVLAAGAVGLVIINNQDGLFSGQLGESAAFPVVAVTRADGVRLKAAAQAGRAVTIQAPLAAKTSALNVVARPAPGTTCTILVGGHFDTVPAAPGANDNASGAANVIELARAFAVGGPRGGLCFATFGAEESGLYGSEALVNRMKTDGQLPRVMMNLDVTGAGQDVQVIGTDNLVQETLAVAAREGIRAVASSLPANTGSDHQSFSSAGVPVVFLTSGDFSSIHTPGDVVSGVDVAELGRVGSLAYATINELLGQVARR